MEKGKPPYEAAELESPIVEALVESIFQRWGQANPHDPTHRRVLILGADEAYRCARTAVGAMEKETAIQILLDLAGKREQPTFSPLVLGSRGIHSKRRFKLAEKRIAALNSLSESNTRIQVPGMGFGDAAKEALAAALKSMQPIAEVKAIVGQVQISAREHESRTSQRMEGLDQGARARKRSRQASGMPLAADTARRWRLFSPTRSSSQLPTPPAGKRMALRRP